MIFIKLRQLLKVVDQYERVFQDSLVINHDFIEYQKHLLKINDISYNEFTPFSKNQNCIDDELRKRKSNARQIQVLDFYFTTLKSKKVHLDDNKVFSKIMSLNFFV